MRTESLTLSFSFLLSLSFVLYTFYGFFSSCCPATDLVNNPSGIWVVLSNLYQIVLIFLIVHLLYIFYYFIIFSIKLAYY